MINSKNDPFTQDGPITSQTILINIKTFTIIFFSSLCLVPGFCQETNITNWGPVSRNFEMSITPKDNQSEFHLRDDVVLTARFKNLRNNTFVLYEYNGAVFDPSYSFKITSPSGQDLSPDMKDIIPSDSGSVKTIAAGQIYSVNLDLSAVSKFETVGSYKIVATRQICDPSGLQFKVISNQTFVNIIR